MKISFYDVRHVGSVQRKTAAFSGKRRLKSSPIMGMLQLRTDSHKRGAGVSSNNACPLLARRFPTTAGSLIQTVPLPLFRPRRVDNLGKQ